MSLADPLAVTLANPFAVTFASPLVLVALILIPVLVVMYVARQRGRRDDRAAFVSPALAAAVVRERPRWRRHLPMLAFLVALLVLILAAARPQTTQAVPVRTSQVMLLVDTSSSMASTDVAPSRLGAVKRAVADFLRVVPSTVSVGLIVFNQHPTLLSSPTPDRATLNNALAKVKADGHTAIGTALESALQQLTRGPKSKRPPSAIVLLSDGYSTTGVDPLTVARQSKSEGIRIDTVALGTSRGTIRVGNQNVVVPPDPQALSQIATVSGGEPFTVLDATHLSAVYQQLGTKLSHKRAKQEITADFAGIGLALLIVGSLLSMRWFGRLI
jgi:Ca-activated chloride channel family protein